MEFIITLIHKPGKTMKVDPLSRHLDFNTGQNDNKQVIVLPSHLFATISMLSSTKLSSWEDCLLHMQLDAPWKSLLGKPPTDLPGPPLDSGHARVASSLWQMTL